MEELCFLFVKVKYIQKAANFREMGKLVILIIAALSTLLCRTFVGEGVILQF